MKKLLLVTATFLSSNLMIAQNQTISLGYGVISTDQAIFTMSMLFSSIANEIGGNGSYKSSSYVGPLTLSYHYTLASNERLSFGGSLAYDRAKFVNKNTNDDAYRFNAFTLAPEGKFKYLDPQSKFNLYGLLGLGFTMISYKNYQNDATGTIPHFNMQFTPLGLEYGENIKGFLELGIGYKGVISGGIAYKF